MLRINPITRLTRNFPTSQTFLRSRSSTLSPFTAFGSSTFGRCRFASTTNATKKWLSGVSAELAPRMDGGKLILSVKSINHGAQATTQSGSTTVNVGKLVDYREYKADAPILNAYHSSGSSLFDVISRLASRNSFAINTPKLDGIRPDASVNQWNLFGIRPDVSVNQWNLLSVPNFKMEKYLVKPHQELKVGMDVASFTDATICIFKCSRSCKPDCTFKCIPETKSEKTSLIGDDLPNYHILIGAVLGFVATWYYNFDFLFFADSKKKALLAGTIFGAIATGSPATAIYIFGFVLFVWLLALSAGLNSFK